LIAGGLPRKQARLVEAWAELREAELHADWQRLQSGQLLAITLHGVNPAVITKPGRLAGRVGVLRGLAAAARPRPQDGWSEGKRGSRAKRFDNPPPLSRVRVALGLGS
jgi:hypothetical protein